MSFKQLFKCCRCDGEFDHELKSDYCQKCYDNYIKELEEENIENIDTEDYLNCIEGDTPKETPKRKVGRPATKPKVEKPAKVVLTEEQKKEKSRAYHRERAREKYHNDPEYRKKRDEMTVKYQNEHKEAKKKREKAYYEKNKELKKEYSKMRYNDIKEVKERYQELKDIIDKIEKNQI
jgi:hypothetical protein